MGWAAYRRSRILGQASNGAPNTQPTTQVQWLLRKGLFPPKPPLRGKVHREEVPTPWGGLVAAVDQDDNILIEVPITSPQLLTWSDVFSVPVLRGYLDGPPWHVEARACRWGRQVVLRLDSASALRRTPGHDTEPDEPSSESAFPLVYCCDSHPYQSLRGRYLGDDDPLAAIALAGWHAVRGASLTHTAPRKPVIWEVETKVPGETGRGVLWLERDENKSTSSTRVLVGGKFRRR